MRIDANRTLRALRWLVALLATALAAAAAIAADSTAAAATAADTTAGAASGRPIFRIGVGDRLDVFIYEDNTSREVIVRPDGRITIPLAGDVDAEGATPQELAARIRKALEPYQKNPTVTVSVSEINSYRVYVLGNVHNQMMVASTSPLRVLQALAMAGGLNEFANKNVIVIRERKGAPAQRLPVNYGKIIRGDALDQNLLLEAGDVVVAE